MLTKSGGKGICSKKNYRMTLERGMNEMEITNLLGKYFKVAVINMLTNLQKSIEDIKEDFNKEI